MDGARVAVFYAAIADPLKFTSHDMTSLFLHEGRASYHFQMALQQELDVPRFRRYAWHTSYGEGWALYAESLAKKCVCTLSLHVFRAFIGQIHSCGALGNRRWAAR